MELAHQHHKVLHRRASGVIRMLPHGEYVDGVPLALAASRFTQHEQPPPYEVGPLVDANSVARAGSAPAAGCAPGSPTQCTGPTPRSPKPTPEEYRELTGGGAPLERLTSALGQGCP